MCPGVRNFECQHIRVKANSVMDSAWQSAAKYLDSHGLLRKECIYQKQANMCIWCLCYKWLLQQEVIQVLEHLSIILFWYFVFTNLEWKHLSSDVIFCNTADRSQCYKSRVQTAKEQSEHIQTFSQHYMETVPEAFIAYFPSAFINLFLKGLC